MLNQVNERFSLSDKLIVAGVLLFKIYFLWALPITGDEIYWIWWGRKLAAGYYDHPPLVGWILGLMSTVSNAMPWYRSVALVTSLVVPFVIYKALSLDQMQHRNKRWMTSLAFLVSPTSLIILMTANDTVLLLTSFLGFYALMRAIHDNSIRWGWIAGILFGLAFLSKYFAVFLFLGLGIFAVRYRHLMRWQLIAAVMIPIGIAGAQNLYYNYVTCWSNILFNFFSRTTSSTFLPEGFAIYLLILGALFTPWGIFWMVRSSRASPLQWQSPLASLPLYAGLPLIGVLAVVSLFQPVGLHWPLLSIPILWMLYAHLSAASLRTFFRINGLVSLVIAMVAALGMHHVEDLLPKSMRGSAVFFLHPKNICPVLNEHPVFATSYSEVALISWACDRDDVHLFASTTKYGREDDHRSDFRRFAGGTIQILLPDDNKISAIASYFSDVRIEPFSVESGITHYRVIGKGFDYESYRTEVLQTVSDRYYTPPTWFPGGQCDFKRQYGF